MMKIPLLLLCSVSGLWFPVHPGHCSEQTHKHTPDPDKHTENTLQQQLVIDGSNEVKSLFITDVESSSSLEQDVSSQITDVIPASPPVTADTPLVCVSCRDCSDSESCSESSPDVSTAACDAGENLQFDSTLNSFPAVQENVSVRETRKSTKEHTGKRTNASRILKEQGPGAADSDPSVPCRDQEIPTFDEWTKIMMEVENEKSQVTQHNSHSPHAAGKKLQPIFTNYASVECGAKILSSNPEAKSTSAILMENMDMYMLNPCNNKIWFIIELCQPIQVKQLEIANFEIFSSNPKDFLVSISDRYPTKKWAKLGTFHARDERTVQSFPLNEHLFAKYIKVDLLSHFGSEHFCPLSLIRVFGTSMMEEYEMNSEVSDRHTHAQDDHDDDQPPDFGATHDKSSNNLIGSAKDALLTMVNNIRVNVIGGDTETATGRAENSSTEELNITAVVLLPEEVQSTWPLTANQPDVSQITETVSPTQEPLVKPTDPPNCDGDASTVQQIVTLLPEDEDQPSGAEEDDEHSRSLSLQEYLLQCCSAPDLIHRKTHTDTKSPVIHTQTPSVLEGRSPLHSFTEDLMPSLTSDLLLSTKHLPSRPSQTPDLTDSLPAIHSTDDREETLPVIVTTKTRVDQASVPISVSSEKTSISAPTVQVEQPEPRNILHPSDGFESRNRDLLDEDIGAQIDQPSIEIDTVMQNSSDAPVHGGSQKESVFMRLNNRIKALEMNMSLSGRYLEQLSQRYRKQVEEMQRAFNKTIIKLQNTSRMAEEQDQKQTDSIQVLQGQLENVTRLILSLSLSVSQLQQEVSERQNYILLCLVLCVFLGVLICVNYRQMCESPAVDSQRFSFSDREPSDDEHLFLRRRASDPPSLSSLQTSDGGAEPISSLRQWEHCPVSKKKKHKLKLTCCPETLGSPSVANVVGPPCLETDTRVDVMSDGSSEGSSQADETLFCGIATCARLCEAIPAPKRWSQCPQQRQRRGSRRSAEHLHHTPLTSQNHTL